jgi:glycosyltransferase involved in cell wall biosynthesis
MPEAFKLAPKVLGKRLVQYGRVSSRNDYYGWLSRGDIVVSTSVQENFGIAVVEAVWHGCLPLLPDRLSYPEILPSPFHEDFLYGNQQDLESKLADLLTGRHSCQKRNRALSRAMEKFSWNNRIGQFDTELAQLAEGHDLQPNRG